MSVEPAAYVVLGCALAYVLATAAIVRVYSRHLALACLFAGAAAACLTTTIRQIPYHALAAGVTIVFVLAVFCLAALYPIGSAVTATAGWLNADVRRNAVATAAAGRSFAEAADIAVSSNDASPATGNVDYERHSDPISR